MILLGAITADPNMYAFWGGFQAAVEILGAIFGAIAGVLVVRRMLGV